MKAWRVLVFCLVVSLGILGCDKIPFLKSLTSKPRSASHSRGGTPPVGETVVARVGNFYITAKEFNKEVENYNVLVTAQGVPQNKLDTRDKKISYLRNEIVRKYILYQEALDRGIDKKPEVIKDVERSKVNIVVSELLKEELDKIQVSSQEVEDFYNQNKELLREPEQRRISEIVTTTEDEAKQVYIELLRGGDFAALARQYSKSDSASKGGDLGFIELELDPKKRVKPDKFYEVAFSPTLEEGNISSIFKLPEGYYIIKVTTIKKPEPKALSELWNNIKNLILFEKQQKAIADLAGRLAGEIQVEVYEGKVE